MLKSIEIFGLKEFLIKNDISPEKAFEISGKIKEALIKQSVYLLDYSINAESIKKIWAENLLK